MSFHTEREPTWGLKRTAQLRCPTLALQIRFLLKLQLCGSSFSSASQISLHCFVFHSSDKRRKLI